jgi:uncharacterized protein (DUF983 family)
MNPSPLKQGVLRGLQHHCPNCGQGRLFSSYLKVRDCDACGHANTAYPSDDGPAYLTILLIGHLLVAPMLAMPFLFAWPVEIVLIVALPVLTAATLLALPFIKGGFIGLQWSISQPAQTIPPLNS